MLTRGGPQHEQQQRWGVSSGVRVGASVVLQVPGLAELPGAQVALEGPDARVDLDVPVAVTVARKRLAAHAAAATTRGNGTPSSSCWTTCA